MVKHVKNIITSAVSSIAVEYNKDALNQVISKLEAIVEEPVSAELLTESKGESIDKITEVFRLYNDIEVSLMQSVKNVLSTVRDVQNNINSI